MGKVFCFIFFFFCSFLVRQDLTADATIVGTVTDSITGFPISGALVEAIRGGQVRYSDTTASDGSYSLTGVQPSNYTLEVSASGYQTQSVGVNPKNNEITTVNFQLIQHGGEIDGIVIDASTTLPISGATVRILQGTNLILQTSTNGAGFYSAPNLAPGDYIVEATASGYQTQIQGAIVEINAITTANFALESNPGNISGIVIDALTTNPIVGALVEVFEGTILIGFADTDASGNYTISSLPPGNYTVNASATGYQSKIVEASVASNSTTTVNFALSQLAGIIAGTVTSVSTGNAIPDATINIFQGTTFVASVLTDSNGQYEISGLMPGNYFVVASAPNFGSADSGATVIANNTTIVNFSLLSNFGTISGTVLDSSTNLPISDATIQVRSDFIIIATAVTDSAGKYIIPNIAPDTYTVTAAALGFQRQIKIANVNSNQNTIVNFFLNPNPGTISGNIIDAITTLPIPNASVYIYQGSTLLDFTMTDANGNYEISDLPPGSFTVLVLAEGYQDAFSEETVFAGLITIADFALNPHPGSLIGKVIDACMQNPISGTIIEVFNGSTIVDFGLTDSNGNYSIDTLAPGNYNVVASKHNYVTANHETTVATNATTTVNFSLFSPILPPASIKGCTKKNKFLTQTEIIHVISWTQSPSPCVGGYQIIRNGTEIAFVPSSNTLEFHDHNRNKKTDVYTVKAVSLFGAVSDGVSVTIGDSNKCPK